MTDPLAPLRARFHARAAADLQRLEMLWTRDPRSVELEKIVHDLAGAGGMFGYRDLSDAALAIDGRHAAGQPAEPGQIDRLLACLRELATD